MSKIEWGKHVNKHYSGVSHGVLYPDGKSGVPWDGLISVSKSLAGEDSEPIYADGEKVLDIPKPRELSATIKAYTYPDEFLPFDGYESYKDIAEIGEQTPYDTFSFSYRSLINGGPHYKIHIFFNLTATPAEVDHNTIGDEVEPIEFAWDVVGKPVELPKTSLRPSSYMTIDSRVLDKSPSIKKDILSALSGDDKKDPSIHRFLEVLTGEKLFREGFVVVEQNDVEWTLCGPDHLIYESDGEWVVTDSNATIYEDGTFLIIDDT